MMNSNRNFLILTASLMLFGMAHAEPANDKCPPEATIVKSGCFCSPTDRSQYYYPFFQVLTSDGAFASSSLSNWPLTKDECAQTLKINPVCK